MAGQHKAQLHAACVDLLSTINAAVTALGLTTFSKVITEPRNKNERLSSPCLTMTLQGGRSYEQETSSGTDETVEVTWTVEVDGDELTALQYEGAVASTLRAARSTLAAAVTDAASSAFDWLVVDGSSELDEDRVNRPAWQSVIVCQARMEW